MKTFVAENIVLPMVLQFVVNQTPPLSVIGINQLMKYKWIESVLRFTWT